MACISISWSNDQSTWSTLFSWSTGWRCQTYYTCWISSCRNSISMFLRIVLSCWWFFSGPWHFVFSYGIFLLLDTVITINVHLLHFGLRPWVLLYIYDMVCWKLNFGAFLSCYRSIIDLKEMEKFTCLEVGTPFEPYKFPDYILL